MTRARWIVGLVVLCLPGVAHANQELLGLQTDDRQWVMPAKDYSATRFSALKQIDTDTVKQQDRVSVGSFRTDGTGPVTVRWETAADLGRYPHLGVTLEPDNGNPLHQGPKVLNAA